MRHREERNGRDLAREASKSNPAPHEVQEPSSTPAGDGEVPQPDGADPDLDAISTGMSVLLRAALRLMRSYSDKR